MTIALYIAAILAGLALLTWSADRFIDGAVGCAETLKMPPMATGLILVAFGTSAPELIVSLMAALTDSGSIAVGNAIGSNIANIGLVLGVTTLLAPIPLRPTVLYRELPVLLIVTTLAWLLLVDYRLSPLDGALLLLMLTLALGFLLWVGRSGNGNDVVAIPESDKNLPRPRAALYFFGGLVLLVISARVLVWGASELAHTLGIDELVVGLTVVAIGTSLPELAATLAAALKGQHDMALGNIVGSNLFNLLAVLAIPALLSPMALTTPAVIRDYGAMAGLTALLAIFAYSMRRKGKLARLEGGILLAIYLAYTAMLVIDAR